MVKREKIVVVKHPNCGTPYTFKVPKDVDLEVGEYVLCNTKRSKCEIGQCITPSFEIIEPKLQSFYGRTVDQLQPVVGRLKPQMFIFEPAGEDA